MIECARKAEPVPSASQSGRNQCSAQASWHCADERSEGLGGPLPLVGVTLSCAPRRSRAALRPAPFGSRSLPRSPLSEELQNN